MTFEDFGWDCIDSYYDCSLHQFMWCEITNQSCKKTTCPRIKEYEFELKKEELLNILKAPSYVVKKFQKEQGLIIDGIPGPEVEQRIKYLIMKERF